MPNTPLKSKGSVGEAMGNIHDKRAKVYSSVLPSYEEKTAIIINKFKTLEHNYFCKA